MSTLDRRIEIAKAALMEYGRPDLAEQIGRIKSRATAPPTDPDGERAYYKATQIAQRSSGQSIACFDCWQEYRWHNRDVFPADCDHTPT